MQEDQIDISIKALACDYKKRLLAAKAAFPKDPMAAGRKAQADWITDVKDRGGTAIGEEPRTGVDGAGGGMTRFDVVFNLNGTDIYMEVQTRGYNSGHKPVQKTGQVIGFAHVSAGAGVPARYYRIDGDPQRIYRWSRRAAQRSLLTADYEPQLTMDY